MEVKGYVISEGYMGFVDGQYMLFPTENDYLEYVADMILNSEKN